MKKFFVLVFALVLSFSIMGTGNAALIDNGGNLIYDTDLGITWYDPSPAYMNWNQAMNWVSTLTYGDVTGWRLPTANTGYHQGEMGHLYYDELHNTAGDLSLNIDPFTNLQNGDYWLGMEVAANINNAYLFRFGVGDQPSTSKSASYYAVAVHPDDIGPNGPISPGGHPSGVPEPATMLLLGLGLIGIAGIRRKFYNLDN